jgi:hypothetical protein
MSGSLMLELTSGPMMDVLRELRDGDPAKFTQIFGSFMPEDTSPADLSDAELEALYARLTVRYVQAFRNRGAIH